MRLLIIAPEAYPVPHSHGTSVESCIYNLASNLSKYHSVSVTVVSRRAPDLPRVSIKGRLRIVRVPSGTREQYIANALRAVDGQSYDQIQVDNRPSFLAAVRKRFPSTPISIFLHSTNYITPPMTSIRKVRSQLKHADLIIVNSESLAYLVRALYPSHGHKVRTVHLGVDTSRFHPPTPSQRVSARRKMGVDGAFVIGFVGRFVPIKGIPVLLKAAEMVAKHIPSTKLLLAGSGKRKYVSQVKSLARKVKVPVHFLGRVPKEKIHEVYWAFDCFVCPTQGHEAFGLVVVEALATGTPCVASANGGMREIITHNANGLLVERFNSPRRFANAILLIARNPGFAHFLGIQGRSTCLSRFNWLSSSEKLAMTYFGGD